MEEKAFPLSQIMENNLVVRIDKLVGELSSITGSGKEDSVKRQQVIDEWAINILEHIKAQGKGVNDLFQVELTPKQKAFVVASIIGLMKRKTAFLKSIKNVYVPTFNLMDDLFKDDVYKIAKIDMKDQTYEKENKLCDAIEEIEDSWIAMVKAISTPKQLLDIRYSLMQKLNNKITKAIILPFMPSSTDNAKLTTFFQIVKDYTESDEINVIDNFQRAVELINELLDEARLFSTEYSQILIVPLFQKSLDIIKRDFEASPAGKPAKIELKSTGKKYPLYVDGETFNLTLVLENKGPGYAREIRYWIRDCTYNITIIEGEKYLGALKPGEIIIDIPCQVKKPDNLLIIDIDVEWVNANGQVQTKSFQIEAASQKADIPWEIMAETDPYSLEPVSSEEDLIGRREIIEQLTAKIRAKSLGSSFLHGQKRVGKTSIAKVLDRRIKNIGLSDHFVIYLECGNFLDLTPINTVINVGRRLCKAVKNSDRRLRDLPIPDFNGALTPLTEFLEDVQLIIPEARILFILDEFDELPVDLFRRDEVGKAFFLPIRTISNQKSFGFLLVGGEKMDYVINSMGDQLNKFEPLRIDYFSQDKHWQDFEDLIKRPVQPYFEFTDAAINRIYAMTAGNPYFTKLICKTLFATMVKKRDAHVTEKEVDEANERALETTEINSFQHFWQDGITEKGPREEEISIRRRKILISLGELARSYPRVTREALLDSVRKQDLETHVVEVELREFERRQILIEDQGCYSCKALFFEEWLKRRGIRDIMTSFSDYDEEMEERKKQELAFIKDEEISELVEKWGVYQGRRINVQDVRAWLNQFGDNRNQRLMFYILQNLRFYGGDVLRLKMKEAHSIVKRGTVHELQEGKRKRNDILISYLDGPGKSGSQFARLYAQENKIYMTNVVEQSMIAHTLNTQHGIKALVFLDDLIGTGKSVVENIKKLTLEVGDTLNRVSLYVIAICGFAEAYEQVEEAMEKLPVSWNIHMLETLTDKDRCFSDESVVFPTADERLAAHKLAMEHGKNLEKKQPLGYGNVQASIVFESNCPNNCLPILFKKTSNWTPLFERK